MTRSVSLAPGIGISDVSVDRGNSKLDSLVRPLANWLQDNHMSALGIANTMRIAHAYYWLKFRRNDEWRRSLYREQFTDLLEENGPVGRPSI